MRRRSTSALLSTIRRNKFLQAHQLHTLVPLPAEMAFMFGERHSGETTIDYPVGGSKAIVDALIRGGARCCGLLTYAVLV